MTAENRTNSILPWTVIVAAGMIARVALAWFSIGSNDADTWPKFATLIDSHGLFYIYDRSAVMNQPPLAALGWVAALRISEATGASYTFVFKLPSILADGACCLMLGLIWTQRQGSRPGWIAAAAFASSLAAILVSAYHCNSDSICAFFALLAAYFAARRKMLWSALALSAGINVKIVPVLLIPPLLSSCRSWREALHFMLGLAIGALPFVPVLLNVGPQFARNVLAYNSHPDRWGVGELLFELHRIEPIQRISYLAMQFYNQHGRYLIFGVIALLSVWSFARRRWDAYELGTLTFAIFLIVAPGFGVQYTILVLPLLFAVSIRWGATYGLVAGIFLLLVYWSNWTGTFPPYSAFGRPLPMPGVLFGVVAWVLLIVYAIRILRAPRASVQR